MAVPQKARQKAGRIRLAVFDVDGVMTDGTILLGDNGVEFKAYNVHDGLGLVMLQQAGIEVAVISSRCSRAVSKRMLRLGVKYVIQGVTDKAQALTELLQELGVDYTAVAFVGDDLIDLPAMTRAGMAIAVANARPEVLARADWITTAPGGHGGVREVCEMLLEAQGKLSDRIKKYTG